MSLRTGEISQQTRAQRDVDRQIDNIRKEIVKKRGEIKDLIYLLSTLVGVAPEATPPGTFKERWEKIKDMSKVALGKLQKTGPDFVRPTRSRVRTTHPAGGDDSKVQQHARDECDINLIIKKHTETGNISHLNPSAPLYIDCSKVSTLEGAIKLVEEAGDNFATLPAQVRKACRNDPVEFMDMIHTEEGAKVLGQAGLEYLRNAAGASGEPPQRQRKPETIPAQQVIPGTEPAAGTKTPETPPTPQGGK